MGRDRCGPGPWSAGGACFFGGWVGRPRACRRGRPWGV